LLRFSTAAHVAIEISSLPGQRSSGAAPTFAVSGGLVQSA